MGTIELILTHYRRIWFFSIPIKIKTGFTFTNKVILTCARNLKIELKDFFDWAEKNQTLYFSEMLYSAYIVYCQEHYTKPDFSKKELLNAFNLLDETKQKDVIRVWHESESFGVKKNKKKAKIK